MITKVIFPTGETSVTIEPMHQWDYGRHLEIDVTSLPTVIEVHFACRGMTEAIAYACAVQNGVITVPVPNSCLEQTTPITAWIYVYDGACSKTVRTITIPITARTKPPKHESVPDNVSDRYTEVITQMNAVVDGLRDGTTPVKLAETAIVAEKATTATASESASVATSAVYATTAGQANTAICDTEGAEIATWYLKNRMNYQSYTANTAIDGGLIEFRITNNAGFTASVITNMQGYGGASLFGITDGSSKNRVARLRFEGATSGQYYVYVDYFNDENTWSVLDSSLYSILYQYLSGVSNAGTNVGPSGGVVKVGTSWVVEEDVNNYVVTVTGGLSVYQDSMYWEVTAESVGIGTVTVTDRDGRVVSITTYTIVDENSNTGGGEGGSSSGGTDTPTTVAIPFYDLSVLGLPTVSMDGTTSDLETDTVDIRKALDNGSVKFALNVDGYGRVEVVMNKYTIVHYGLYMCVYYGGDIVCTMMIAENALQVSVEQLTKLPSVSTDDDGKILRVVNGQWVAATVPSAEMEAY